MIYETFLIIGMIAMNLGAIGIIRLPDVLSRLHANAKCDMGGAITIFIGLIFYNGLTAATIKILVISLLICFINPVIAHSIAEAFFKAKGRWYERYG
jgi:multicomponent Na+:H+ antiporter subunit G